jgi:hypothetical protein
MRNFQRIYPPNSGKLIFDGGKNNKFEKSIIEDNESPDCLNVDFDADSVGTRPGFIKVNTASVGAYVCDGLYTRKGTNSAETMVAFFNGTGYTLNGTSFVTIASAQSVFTGGFRVACAQMENHAFFGNGNRTPYKYNGTAWTRHGVPQPSGTASANSNGGGALSGNYMWKISYVNSQSVEGNVSDALATFVVTAKTVRLTSLPVAPQSWGVAARRLYRTADSGTTFLRVATINDNTTTLYDDTTADTSLGALAPVDKGEPPNYSSIIYHQNRLFMLASDGLVWYTDLNEPYTVASTNFIPVGDGSTDFPKALAVYSNSVVVFGQRNTWLIYMPDNDATSWQVIKSQSPYTSISPFGIFEYDNKLCFPAVQNDKFVGFAALKGNVIEPTSTLLSTNTAGGELKSLRIEPDMFDVQETYLTNISSIVFKNKAYITLTKAAGSTTNNRVYMMDFSKINLSKNQKEAWAPWSGLNAAQFTVYAGSLYFGVSTATGYVYKQNPGVYSDDGVAINSYYWTKEFTGPKGEVSYAKDFRYANLLVDLAGAYYMNVAVRTDSDSGDGTSYQVDLNPSGSLWGVMTWGGDTWGAGALQSDLRLYLAGARGKRIQFKFSNQNTVGQRFKVHWQNFTYNLKGPR